MYSLAWHCWFSLHNNFQFLSCFLSIIHMMIKDSERLTNYFVKGSFKSHLQVYYSFFSHSAYYYLTTNYYYEYLIVLFQILLDLSLVAITKSYQLIYCDYFCNKDFIPFIYSYFYWDHDHWLKSMDIVSIKAN